MVMERVASEYNKLQYNVSHSSDHPLIDEMTPRIARITATLQNHLQDKFQSSLEHKDREGLIQSLQTYASINKQSAAEEMFQNVPVRPYMEQVSHSIFSSKCMHVHTHRCAYMYICKPPPPLSPNYLALITSIHLNFAVLIIFMNACMSICKNNEKLTL